MPTRRRWPPPLPDPTDQPCLNAKGPFASKDTSPNSPPSTESLLKGYKPRWPRS
jgi:hypothetical protein